MRTVGTPTAAQWPAASTEGAEEPICLRLYSMRMLSKEDNETVSRVGAGTAMGELMRQYWLPAMLSSELPTPDSDPVRVLLLGEKLIAFRDTNGQVGLMANNCPHRGASLF